mgnify:CR=1 FL=1
MQPSLFPTDSYAISLHQPWATLWSFGIKSNETRDWHFPVKLTGQTIYIHAAQRWDNDIVEICATKPFANALVEAHNRLKFPQINGVTYQAIQIANTQITLPIGALIGKVTLSQSVSASTLSPTYPESAFGNFSAGRIVWQATDHTPILPIPYTGRQRFFRVRLA